MPDPKRFGRAWKVEIITAKLNPDDPEGKTLDEVLYTFGSETWVPEPLHITFDTTQTIQQAYWICDLVIYNLNRPSLQDMILYGMTCRLSAGYMSDLVENKDKGLTGQLGVIFEGTIFQPLWEREGGHTDKLTLHCIVGLLEGTNNFIGQTFAGGVTQRKLVAQMAAACRQPLQLDIDAVDDKEIVTRATTYFGQPNDFLAYHASTNNALTWFSHMTAHIRDLNVDEKVPEIEYNDTNGLIGTPQQTQNGILCRVLLDSRVVIRSQIRLTKNVIVRQQVRTPMGELPSVLDPHGEYCVGKIRHYGDSRGNDWYTDITAFVHNASLLSLGIQL